MNVRLLLLGVVQALECLLALGSLHGESGEGGLGMRLKLVETNSLEFAYICVNISLTTASNTFQHCYSALLRWLHISTSLKLKCYYSTGKKTIYRHNYIFIFMI